MYVKKIIDTTFFKKSLMTMSCLVKSVILLSKVSTSPIAGEKLL